MVNVAARKNRMDDSRKTKQQLITELENLRNLAEEQKKRLDAVKNEGVKKNVQSTLYEKDILFQTLLNAMPAPVFFKDKEGVYMGCNSSFEEFLGLPNTSVIGKTVYDISSSELADVYFKKDAELLNNPGTQHYEAVVVDSLGNRRNVIFHKATFTDKKGRVAGLVGVIQDITRRRKAEEEAQKAHQELEERIKARTKELAQKNKELKKEIAQRKEVEKALIENSRDFKLFAHSIIHDLKSPTMGIFGIAQRLKDSYQHLLDDRGNRYCDQIIKASELVVALVEKINTYMSTKEAPLKIESISITEVLEIVRDEFFQRLSLRGIKLVTPEEDITIRADRMSLIRAFRNFVDNALKYGGDLLSQIRIEYERGTDHHIFSIVDDGIGINKEHSEKVFGLYEKSGPVVEAQSTGLGLAIVKEIASRHGGETWVGEHNSSDAGVTFYFSISVNL